MVWRRWEIVMVGQESGHRVQMPFMRFWRKATAESWVTRLNEGPHMDPPLVTFELYRRRA